MGKLMMKMLQMLWEVYGTQCPGSGIWHHRFKDSHESLKDDPFSG